MIPGEAEKFEKIKRGHEKTRKALDKLIASRSLNYTKERVKISSRLTLEVKCQRFQPGECHPDSIGKAYCFEVYAIVNGEAVDSCTDHWSIDDDIKYLIKCWGWSK